MAKQERGSKPGFVIKLTNETVQKLAEEEQQAKVRNEEASSKNLEESDIKDPPIKAANPVTTESTSKEGSSSENSNLSEPDRSVSKATQNETDKNTSDNATEAQATADKPSHTDTTNEPTQDSNTTWGDYAPYITYEGEEAVYTDPNTNHKYNWNKETTSWALKEDIPGREYTYEDDTHIYTEPDGSKFFWDVGKKAWIPKVDDDFLAMYQMSYGFVDNTKTEDSNVKDDNKKEQKKMDSIAGVKRKNEPQWFQPPEETNTKVYVSDLPLDMNEEEFVNLMQKCGLVERDPSSQKMKVKLYYDKEHNCFKGDALCTYIKIESVDLALKLLDGMDYKGNKIKVERAHFQMKGEYNPALKPKKKKKKELEKIKKMQQKLFDWRPEKFVGERSKHERVVIIKNLFHPTDFDKEVQLILDYQQDLREECSKSGEVRKVVIYDGHPEGVAQVTMKEPEQADAVIQLINGRWFGKRQITAEIWDGRTKYRIAETDADINKRRDKWDNFLEGKEEVGKENSSTDKKDSQEQSQAANEVVNETKEDSKPE